jgi:hypothetical protein
MRQIQDFLRSRLRARWLRLRIDGREAGKRENDKGADEEQHGPGSTSHHWVFQGSES